MTERDAKLERLAAARGRVAALLTGVIVALYFGFLLLIAFARPLLAVKLAPGLSLGIALGALMIVLSWLSTLVYVRWMKRYYDAAITELRD